MSREKQTSDPRSIFATEEASAVVDSARALLEGLSEEQRLLSVDKQGVDVDGARRMGGPAES